MSIQKKLEELKQMHEQGLISAVIYEEQQKALLAGQFAGSQTGDSKPIQSNEAGFLDLKKNAAVLKKVAIFLVLLALFLWVIYLMANGKDKEAMEQAMAQTGIGRQMIPWVDRAATLAGPMIETKGNKEIIATNIQTITHPTGDNPVLEGYEVKKIGNSLIIEFTVSWKGGMLGGKYNTVVDWEVNEGGHVKAAIVKDTAPFAVGKENAESLDGMFHQKIYPAFFNTLN